MKGDHMMCLQKIAPAASAAPIFLLQMPGADGLPFRGAFMEKLLSGLDYLLD